MGQTISETAGNELRWQFSNRLAVLKQAGCSQTGWLVFSTNRLARAKFSASNFSIVRTEISIFVKIHSKITSTASNSIDTNPFLLQIIRLSSDYDAVHFGGDLGCEEDENIWNGSPKLAQI
jgi:hypothetical protein